MNQQRIYLTKSFATALAFIIVFQISALGQALPTALSIEVAQGEGTTNRVGQRVAQEPVVRVTNENQQPISEAAVVFTLPTEGATGAFGNGSKTLTVMTDAQGRAVAQGLRLNAIPGKVPVHITASFKGLSVATTITLFSEAPAGYKPPSGGGGHGKLIGILAVIGAGAAGGIYYATHQSSSSSPATPSTPPAATSIGITAGTGTITPPH